MSQAGYTPIQLYYSSTTTNVPLAANLASGELAINITDGKLFYKDNGGVVQTIATKSSAGFTWPGAGIANSTGSAWGTSYSTSGSGTTVALATSPTLTTPALSAETFSTAASVTAGTNAQGQGALTNDYNVITTAASNPSGVTLPTATTGRRIVIVNKGTNSVNIYPATGGSIDALAANASIALTVGGVMEFNASSTTQWYSSYNLYTSASVASGVTSFSAGSTGFTPSTATTGAITLSGTLAIGNGGTNSTSTPTSGGVPYGTGTAYAFTAAGTSGQVLTSNGSSAPTWAAAPAGGISYTRVTANTTLTNNQGVIADTTGGTFTVTLPATPSSGNQVWIADGGSWGTTNLTVGRNGSTIEGTAADLTLDISGVEIQMIYDGTTWNVYVLGGAAGVTTTGSGNTVLADSPTITTPTISGNETYTGSGGRILADFDNATVTNRRAFQTSTTNASTGIYALPNGTSTAASWQAANSSDPTNASKILIATNASTDVQLVSGINGSGTYLPLSFYNNGAQKMQLSTAGSLGIGPAFSPTNNALLELAAGTSSVAPLKFTSGTNLTSPIAGAVEYDGTNFYATPTTGTTEQRGAISVIQQFVLSSDVSAFGASIGNFFGSNSAVQLAGTTTYFIEAYCYFLKTTAGTATWAALFSSVPTVAHATLEYTPVTGFTTSIITGAMVNAEVTANGVANMAFAATASLSTAVYHVAKFRIFVTTSGPANLRFNLTQSAGTATPRAGSWYRVRKVATNSGNFVA